VRRGVFFDMSWNWLALAAAVILAAIVASSFLPRLRQPGADQFLATQLIGSHVRSLMANHLTDVASSDQHTVKPWLDVKLDFAAPVVDLSGEGFPLIGGRLDYLENHSVAALVYQRRKHFINLFIWPTTPADSKEQKMVERQGYHLVHWIDGDFTYWAVSDVSVGDLQNFKQLFEGQVLHRWWRSALSCGLGRDFRKKATSPRTIFFWSLRLRLGLPPALPQSRQACAVVQ
jgi:anti-sigma factor RsiW